MKVAVSELKPGMYLAEDLVDRRQNLPLFSNGLQLNEKNILQIQKLFDADYTLSVIELESTIAIVKDPSIGEKAGTAGAATLVTKLIPAQNLAKGEFEREEVVQMYQNNLLKTPQYQNAKTFVNKYFDNVGSVLTTFSKTGNIDEGEVLDLAHNVVTEIQSGDGFFDPSLLYLNEIEQWDPSTFQHSFDVGVFTLIVATKMGNQFDELTSLFIAGLLHDIGKFIYSKFKLNDMDYIVKKPGKLSGEEYGQIKQHVNVYKYIKDWFPDLSQRDRENILYGITDHHERVNGSGYLGSKKGQSIAFSARLIAVCDVYDALIRRRSYKTMINASRAMLMMIEMQKTGMYDKGIFAKFYQDLGRFPTGGVVMTNRGIAVVVRQNPKDPNRPVLVYPDKNEEIDTETQSEIEIKDI